MADEKTTFAGRGAAGDADRDTLQIVTVASQAQAAKVRAILERMDSIIQLDPGKVNNIAELLRAAKADGGCGIGCW